MTFDKAFTNEDKAELEKLTTLCRGDILKATTIAASGHPGGSMSTIDMLATVYKYADISPENWESTSRDRVYVSHGHVSPAVYSALGRNGFFDVDQAIGEFRLAGSIYEGHIERMIKGVEWTTGNLGQGLSAACGAAIAGKIRDEEFNVYCFMGDGESQKGQISEARRFAVQHDLNNITAFIDYNKLQISGNIEEVMFQNIKDDYAAAGWHVICVDGHDFEKLFGAVKYGHTVDRPVLILAETIMGKGVSFMENIHGYHGKPLTEDQLSNALTELGLENDLDKYKKIRANFKFDAAHHELELPEVTVKYDAKEYGLDVKTDCRSAFGDAIYSLVKNSQEDGMTPFAVFDCDLAGSVKTDKVEKEFPVNFIQSGIQEHHTAAAAAAASCNGVVSFFADFGVFGVDEVYNQQRLADINGAGLKTCTTHVGIDVGEDGKTHQCLDYVGALRNVFGYRVITPADPNQTYKAVCYAAENPGNFLVAMGRSKLPTIPDITGEKPAFGDDYTFEYGKVDVLTEGDFALATYGSMTNRALQVADILAKEGINVSVLNCSCPLHPDMEAFENFLDKPVFVYEDHNEYTGLAATLANKFSDEGTGTRIVRFGVKGYAYSGKPDEIFKMLGLDPETVAETIKEEIS
ncbi:MAG: transketolase [Denitrovibrio sp.]|nr:MAG: transketolase [Denitrovibrio sp.]